VSIPAFSNEGIILLELTTWPHVPQLLLSEVRSGQAPLQRAKPLSVHLQAPDEQVEPVGHYKQVE
jgi:hypothetical protein